MEVEKPIGAEIKEPSSKPEAKSELPSTILSGKSH
jgi:hypothetical protein